MRTTLPDALRLGRIRCGQWGTPDDYGCTGAFMVLGPCGRELKIIASDATGGDISEGWEHVSVSMPNRCPNWQEMSFVKDPFWGHEETVIQFHPPKSDYVNNHAFCLHLWRDTQNDIRRPPSILVGIAGLELSA